MTGSTRNGCAALMVCAMLASPCATQAAWADEAPPSDATNSPPAAASANKPGAPPQPAQHAPDPTAGDRTALILQDMAQHPPQAQIPSQDPSHLKTAKMKLGGLLDRSVRGTENSEVGRVIDVMTGDDGKPAALELDVGGFMGVGNRKIAVAWGLFDLSRTDSNDPLRVALSEAQVRSAPAADGSDQIEVVTGAAPVTGPETVPETVPETGPAAGPVAGPAAGPNNDAAPGTEPAPASARPAHSRPALDAAPVTGHLTAPSPNPRKSSSQGGVAGSDGRF